MLENSPAGTIVGAVEAFDMDECQVISFEIIAGNDHGTFIIDRNYGIFAVADPAKLDYEDMVEIILSVSVADNHDKEPLEGSFATLTLKIYLKHYGITQLCVLLFGHSVSR